MSQTETYPDLYGRNDIMDSVTLPDTWEVISSDPYPILDGPNGARIGVKHVGADLYVRYSPRKYDKTRIVNPTYLQRVADADAAVAAVEAAIRGDTTDFTRHTDA